MGRGIARFFTQPAVLEPYLGTDSAGADLFGPPITVLGYLDGKRQLVRTPDGEQVVSGSTLFCPLSSATQAAAPPNSRVTVAGAVARVITANPNGGVPGTRLPDHLAIALQ